MWQRSGVIGNARVVWSSWLLLSLTIQGFAGFGPGKRGASLAPKSQFHFPCAFSFAHLALAEADIAAFHAALLLILGFIVGADSSDVPGKVVNALPLSFAHLAFCAAFILALPAALTWRFLGSSISCGAGVGTSPLRISFSCCCSDWICSWRSAAFRSCADVILIMFDVM